MDIQNVSKLYAKIDRGALVYQYESGCSNERTPGYVSVKRYRSQKFKSILCCKASSVSMMHEAVKHVGWNHISSHWSVYVKSKTYWSPLSVISQLTFISVTGGCFVCT